MHVSFLPRFALATAGFLALLWSFCARAQDGPPPAPVRVATAQLTSMSATVLAPGTVVSRQDASVAAEIAGRLEWVAEVGQEVEQGEVIARIDDESLELELRQAEATVRRLEASLRYASSQLDRQRQLASQNIAARNALEESESQRDMIEQDLIQARVAAEQIRHRLDRSSVRAPFGGRVVERYREAGEYLPVGGEVTRLVATRNIEVRAQAPIAVARHVSEGMEVTVRDGERSTVSHVRTVIPVGDERSRMIEVRVSLEGPEWVIGAPVRVALPEGRPVEVVAVPRDALVLRQDAVYVYRLIGDDTVEQVAVATGIGNGELIQVSGDIRGGDKVVIRGGERLRPGQRVIVAAEETAGNADVKLARGQPPVTG